MCFVFVRILHPEQSRNCRKRHSFSDNSQRYKKDLKICKIPPISLPPEKRPAAYSATGISTRKQEPSPTAESTPICAPICSAMLLQIESPSPVPCVKVSTL